MAQRLKQINLDWKFQSRLRISIPDLQNSPQKQGVWWVVRLKFSISIENFNPGGRSWFFSIFGPLGYACDPPELFEPQRNCVTKIFPNVRVNFLVRFASKPLFYWIMIGNHLELFRIPEGPKIKKIEISIEIENFDRDWKFRASHPPRPYFLWGGGGGNRDIEIKIFERDQKFRSRLKISIEIKFFWSLGPLGYSLCCSCEFLALWVFFRPWRRSSDRSLVMGRRSHTVCPNS